MFLTRTERVCPRDPDVDAPVTRRERFFHMIYRIMDGFYSIEAVFAFKTTTGFMLLSLPAYLPQSVGWFTGWGGQWVANTLLMWMFPMAGMFNFTQVIILGLMGSVSGCILSIVLWEIVRGNPYGIAALSFLTITSFQYLFFTSQIYSYLSVMTLYTYLMVTTTGYQTAVGGALENDIIELAAGKRMVFVVLGIICSFLVNLVPRPVTGRVELRKRVANTFKDLATLYGIIFADILIDRPGTPYPSLNQVKAFRQLALHIQRQLKDQETYLRLSKLEPPLRGQFPFATYQSLIEKLNNMADLVEGMAYTARSLDKTWKRPLIAVLDQGKFDYVACLLTVMRQLSATMISKMPLPPYMISPDDLKHQFSENLCRVISEYPEQVHNDTFPSYCAYSVASYTFTQELNDAAACIENLVGVENPQQWLYMHI
ncbi:uncharacterized protein B0P05DRAFT_469211 [Gilbertella persicaria]|uniref:uncharacterized protein n=1 Tax=Gilbertella persicaria TaxID=101096 RepID=UPI00221EC233|nr:uncharacterized protein B0P05DRAFT_469211 [Gilbertella persicaria]KAI8080157.1 hypothetical protein B0P05DRAFT_469211 [Gilbertella persicaria]